MVADYVKNHLGKLVFDRLQKEGQTCFPREFSYLPLPEIVRDNNPFDILPTFRSSHIKVIPDIFKALLNNSIRDN
jgi:hypothetical protein